SLSRYSKSTVRRHRRVSHFEVEFAEYSKAGALLVTLAKDRQWKHPDEKRMIKADELLLLLTAEANRVQQALGGGTYIYVHLLDLRPRLPTEAHAKP
ncbi:hypothetical protein ACLHZT_21535, partial [Aeromonas veronii]|uniref:hypothetical protein n=1 Tax=Aeromonas veronii TaxID=654 RepID=UPI003D023C45